MVFVNIMRYVGSTLIYWRDNNVIGSNGLNNIGLKRGIKIPGSFISMLLESVKIISYQELRMQMTS